MALVPEKQLDIIRASWIGALNFSFPNASSSIVTGAITTALSTAADDGGAVPLQVSANRTQEGVVVANPKNRVEVVVNATQLHIDDGSGNEVYGRITEAAGVYTLSLYSLVAGVETPFVAPATAIDFAFPYRFTADHYPTDAGIMFPVSMVENDPSQAFSSQALYTERLTVTAPNTVTDLTETPDVVANIILFVNGIAVDSLGGGSAAFTVAGSTITWSAVNAGYALATTDVVLAQYTYTI